jgi:hypothetical protein
MIHSHESTTAAVRTVFIIDHQRKIRLTMIYPMDVGRNFDEVLRVIDALQTGHAKHIATPADWTPGRQGHHPHFDQASRGGKDDADCRDAGDMGQGVTDHSNELLQFLKPTRLTVINSRPSSFVLRSAAAVNNQNDRREN